MNETNLILEGVQLMLVGMGMVFVFLSILVLATSMMHKILNEKSLTNQASTPSQTVTDEEIAVITTAIHKFRSKKD